MKQLAGNTLDGECSMGNVSHFLRMVLLLWNFYTGKWSSSYFKHVHSKLQNFLPVQEYTGDMQNFPPVKLSLFMVYQYDVLTQLSK